VELGQDWRQEGRLKGEDGRLRGQGLHDSKPGRAHPTHGMAAQDAARSIQDQVAGMPAAAQAALLQTLMAALPKSAGAGQGLQALEDAHAVNKMESNVLSV
jgi:hypothetical protein